MEDCSLWRHCLTVGELPNLRRFPVRHGPLPSRVSRLRKAQSNVGAPTRGRRPAGQAVSFRTSAAVVRP